MKIVRFIADSEEGVSYGKLINNEIYKIIGNIFEDDIDNMLTGEHYNRDDIDLLSPVNPPNIIAIGLNYKEHARETGVKLPQQPLVFSKTTSSLTGPGDNIKLPKQAPDMVDYEAELGVVISRRAKNISGAEASDYILGYTCVNDVTARDCQQNDGQWTRAKSFDTFCPVGPWIETELNPDNCVISSVINDEVRQNSTTADMIFSVFDIVSYLANIMTLLPGTLITTGTPSGVGAGYEPGKFLQEGDVVKIRIEGIGILENRVAK